MGDILRFEVPGCPEYMSTVRLTAGSVATQCGYNLEQVNDIQLAVEDACKFIVCHGKEGFSDRYEIIFDIDPKTKSINLAVSDYCRTSLIKQENRHFCMHCPEEGDMGIFVIESLMDSYKLEVREDGCKKLTMVKAK